VLCGRAKQRRTGEYMTEVRISSLCERPCAGIEDTLEALIGTGGRREHRHRKVHSLIDKVYDRINLIDAWKHVRENKGSAGIDGLTIAAFAERESELLATLHEQLLEGTYRPRAVKRVAIPKAAGGTRNLGIPSVSVIDRVVQQALAQKMSPIFEPHLRTARSDTAPAAHHIWRCGRYGARSTRVTCGS